MRNVRWREREIHGELKKTVAARNPDLMVWVQSRCASRVEKASPSIENRRALQGK